MKKIEDVEKELRSEKLNSIYFFYGEELFLLETNLKKIQLVFGEYIKGINYIMIDETSTDQIISELETPAFGYEKKLIIIRNTGILKKDGKRKNLELEQIRKELNTYITNNINMINSSIILIFIEEETDPKSELYKTIDKLGIICKFEFQKPAQIEKRIKGICKAYKVEIAPQTLRYFIEVCGINMQELINEIRKLIEYVGENGTIKKDDIDILSIKKLESIIFELTDSLGKKDTKQALQVLQNLIYSKEPVQKILITLYNYFKKIYFTKLAGTLNKNIAECLKLKPNQIFLVSKYIKQAQYFNEKELKEILKKLRDLDYKYKIGLIDIEIGLESILCRYCSITQKTST